MGLTIFLAELDSILGGNVKVVIKLDIFFNFLVIPSSHFFNGNTYL